MAHRTSPGTNERASYRGAPPGSAPMGQPARRAQPHRPPQRHGNDDRWGGQGREAVAPCTCRTHEALARVPQGWDGQAGMRATPPAAFDTQGSPLLWTLRLIRSSSWRSAIESISTDMPSVTARVMHQLTTDS